MMTKRRCICLVDLGFGDSGKGSTTDFLVRKFNCDLVVRYSGGCQAGHNVQLPDGRRHTFSQFGAGTFWGAKTFLGPSMIISPGNLVREANALADHGIHNPLSMVTIHPDCLVSTPFHVAMNRLREIARGNTRHGSCGLGIGETRSYWLKYGTDAIVADDLQSGFVCLESKLHLLKERLVDELRTWNVEYSGEWDFRRWSVKAIAGQLRRESHSGVNISYEMPIHHSVAYEAAQGVLLDQTYGFQPHTTWSDVTLQPAYEMINPNDYDEITTLGITRSYLTRHGVGPLPSEDPELSATLSDPGNPHNDWQGTMRFGWLDFPLLDYAIANCGVSSKLDGIVVNHLDQVTDSWKCVKGRGYDLQTFLEDPQNRPLNCMRTQVPVTKQELLELISQRAPIFATSHGPTHQHRELMPHFV